ncbi:DDE-type integrase/transposase/recombinase [Amycolatopsis acidiphila]|uniref:DDE-type integrase/transposase/recombinase n=1 Tax=Amycolatopsis acidiphila TaxID=715473 RepID=A0A558AHX6_9PSEU|nr:DDE-type integrase/transposase/recombinase [Amycolatopsis acidiphila]
MLALRATFPGGDDHGANVAESRDRRLPRRVIGWRTSTSMTAQLVLDAIGHAIWTRQREGRPIAGVIQHHDRGSRHTSVAYSERLAADDIRGSVGATGASYDNTLAESINGLHETELIKSQAPGAPSTTSRSPPPNGSIGSTNAGSTSTAATSHRPRWRTATTLGKRPRQPPKSQISLRTRRGGSAMDSSVAGPD